MCRQRSSHQSKGNVISNRPYINPFHLHHLKLKEPSVSMPSVTSFTNAPTHAVEKDEFIIDDSFDIFASVVPPGVCDALLFGLDDEYNNTSPRSSPYEDNNNVGQSSHSSSLYSIISHDSPINAYSPSSLMSSPSDFFLAHSPNDDPIFSDSLILPSPIKNNNILENSGDDYHNIKSTKAHAIKSHL